MSKYRIIYEDPLLPEAPVKILIPSPNWIKEAVQGNLPPIWVHWQLQNDEHQAIKELRHSTFRHNKEKWELQFTAPRIGNLTEEEAIIYLIMKEIPRHIWSIQYNRPMLKIVTVDQIPSDRSFRNAWRME